MTTSRLRFHRASRLKCTFSSGEAHGITSDAAGTYAMCGAGKPGLETVSLAMRLGRQVPSEELIQAGAGMVLGNHPNAVREQNLAPSGLLTLKPVGSRFKVSNAGTDRAVVVLAIQNGDGVYYSIVSGPYAGKDMVEVLAVLQIAGITEALSPPVSPAAG